MIVSPWQGLTGLVVVVALLLWGGTNSMVSAQDLPVGFVIVDGDDPELARSAVLDPAWQTVPRFPTGIFWLRIPLTVHSEWLVPETPQLRVELAGAYEVYWDGQLMGSSGQVGPTAESEIAGQIVSLFDIRHDELSEGDHMIAIRVSNWHAAAPETFPFEAIIVDGAHAQIERTYLLSLMGAVAALGIVIALFFLIVVGRSDERGSHLLYAVLAVLVAIVVSLANMQQLGLLAYLHYGWVAVALAICSYGVFGTLGALLIMRLELRPIWAWLIPVALIPIAAAAPVTILGSEHDSRAFLLLAIFGAGASLYALSQRNSEYRAPLLVSLTGAAAVIIDPDSLHFFLVVVVCVLSLIAATEYRQTRTLAAEKELRSKRLELQLLKKVMQPHFLMNTLAATQELVETSPARASTFIDALANQFRSLIQLSDQNVIRLSEEILLCQQYLDIMSLRLETEYTLVIDGDPADLLIPPGVLHSLIENSFSRTSQFNSPASVRLMIDDQGEQLHLRLTTPLAPIGSSSAISARTGTRYVEARLDEVYGTDWSLSAAEVDGAWQVDIQMAVKHGE